jgi:hypothetical protein
MKRWATAYVVALHHHKERESVDPMNLDSGNLKLRPNPSGMAARKATLHHIGIAEKGS